MKKALILLVASLSFACSHSGNISSASEKSQPNLAQLIERYHQFEKTTSPFNDTSKAENNAQLPDLSDQTLRRNTQGREKIYQALLAISPESLSQSDQINWSVLTYKLKNQIDSYYNKEHYMPLTSESGFHVGMARVARRASFNSVQDYQDYIARLSQFPRYFDQQMYWMEQGITEGITQPAIVLEGFEESISAYLKDDIEQSEFFQPFTTFPTHITEQERRILIQQAKQQISSSVYPSYQKFFDFMVQRYQPNARKNIAASSLPAGEDYYQNRVTHYTTLDLTAEQIHQIGLEEVKRIRREMEQIIQKVGHQGDFASFVEFLRTDPQFYATTPLELLKEASYIAKKADAQLPRFFKNLPRTPYGVIPVPDAIAPKYTTGRYSGPAKDDQPGNYWVNTYRLDRRPLYVLESLTLHEAVPGHHLQGSIAREMEDVPKFRNSTYISAFGEGWGLYSEYLGIEMGFYQDPYSDFGRLTYEMWRACRLVVDTGMHIKGWSRAQAMEFLASNTALSLHNVKTEIDRYISWPGQALSYKIGEITIKRLRADAEMALGRHFDLRAFHDQLLKNGSMPLSMLEQVMVDYVKKELEQLKNAN